MDIWHFHGEYLLSTRTMAVYNLYVFDKYGVMLFYNEWNRLKKSGMTQEEVNELPSVASSLILSP